MSPLVAPIEEMVVAQAVAPVEVLVVAAVVVIVEKVVVGLVELITSGVFLVISFAFLMHMRADASHL